MRFRDFCQNFPLEQADWPLVRPSKVIPLQWRETLMARMGSILAASDRSRAKSSSRLGVSLRPYQAGDRLATLSIPQLMRTGDLLARVDESPGQFAVRIFVVTGDSLQFRSADAQCTKGQVCLGTAGLIEAIHLRQNQSVRVIFCERRHLQAQLVYSLHPRLAGAAVSVISDFLDGSLEHDIAVLRQSAVRAAALYCIRDPWEQPDPANPLGQVALELAAPQPLPHSQSAMAPESGLAEKGKTFSGPLYLTNLLAERGAYERLARDSQYRLRFISESSAIFDVVKFITESYALARYAQQPATAT